MTPSSDRGQPRNDPEADAARDTNGSASELDMVLGTTIDSVRRLGFRSARMFVREPGRWRTVPQATGSDRRVPDVVREAADASEVRAFKGRRGEVPRYVIAVPMRVRDLVVAVMAVGADTAPGPTEQDVEIFRSLAGMTSVALEHIRRSDEHRMVIERLADLDRMKNDFLSTVSHELRTPLTVITGMGRTLEHQWDSLDEEIRVDFLTRLNANAATLDHVIAQLLDFSKLEAGQLRPAMSEIDFSILLPAVVDRLHLLLARHEVELDVEPGLHAGRRRRSNVWWRTCSRTSRSTRRAAAA